MFIHGYLGKLSGAMHSLMLLLITVLVINGISIYFFIEILILNQKGVF